MARYSRYRCLADDNFFDIKILQNGEDRYDQSDWVCVAVYASPCFAARPKAHRKHLVVDFRGFNMSSAVPHVAFLRWCEEKVGLCCSEKMGLLRRWKEKATQSKGRA